MVVTKYKIKMNVPSLLRFALLTDFHNGDCGEVMTALENENADAFLVCGDFIHIYYAFGDQRETFEESFPLESFQTFLIGFFR